MIGVAIVFASIVGGTLLAAVDPVAGLTLIVGGGIGGLVVISIELS